MKTTWILIGLFAASLAARAESIVLSGATVHTVSGGTIEKGQVLIVDGKIAAVGEHVVAENATVVDLTGRHLYPGLILATSSLGLAEIGAVRATQDTNEVGAFAPDVQAWVAVNPDSELIPVARANGITHALTIPLGGTVTGHSGLIRLTGWTYEEMTVAKPVALHLVWPSMDLNLTPRSEWRSKEEWKSPEEQAEARRARVKEIDDFFEEAKAYARARQEDKVVPAWEALLPLVRNEVPLMIHADDVRQIKAAVEWAAGKGFRIILAGARDAHLIAGYLAEKRVPVIYEATMQQPAFDWEPYDVHFKAADVLRRAGVKVAFSNGTGNWAAADARNLPYHAAMCSAFGMPPDEAVRAITLNPAEILGVADRLGSIEVGKEASLIAVDGDLLDIRANVKRMWIAGKETSLESRHTKLFEKYRNRPKPENR